VSPVVFACAVEVYKNNEFVVTLKAGNFFGEQALLTNHKRNATIKVGCPVHPILESSSGSSSSSSSSSRSSSSNSRVAIENCYLVY